MAVGSEISSFTGDEYCIINPVITKIKHSIPFTECHKRSQNGYELISLAIFNRFSIAFKKNKMDKYNKKYNDKKYGADYI